MLQDIKDRIPAVLSLFVTLGLITLADRCTASAKEPELKQTYIVKTPSGDTLKCVEVWVTSGQQYVGPVYMKGCTKVHPSEGKLEGFVTCAQNVCWGEK